MKAWTCAQYSTRRRGRRSDARLSRLDVVGPHPGVERHVVGPLKDVDRVDLEHARAGQGAVKRAHRGHRVAPVEEALGAQRDPPRLGLAQ